MRNLKVLGLSLLAALLAGAVVASGASADYLTSDTSPVTLAGGNEPGSNDQLVVTSGNAVCKKIIYHGTTTTPTTAATITPTYPVKIINSEGKEEQNCTASFFAATIDTNGCHYIFSLNGAAPATQGDAKIECPVIGGVRNEITITTLSGATVKCTIHIPEQTLAANSVTYSTIGAGATREVTVEVGISSLTYSHTKGTGIGTCTTGSATNGTLLARAVVTGSNDIGGSGHVGLFLS